MISIRRACILGMLFASASLQGYDVGYMNGVLASSDFAERFGSDDGEGNLYLTSKTRSLFSSIIVVGELIGVITSSLMDGKFGRKKALITATTLYIAGVVMQVIGVKYAVFVVGRVLLGAAVGAISVVSPAYLVESSSPENRGRFLTGYVQFITTGNMLANGIAWGTSKYTDARSWRINVAFQLVLSIIIVIGSLMCPESPGVLVKKGKILEARHSLSILMDLKPESPEVNKMIHDLQADTAEDIGYSSILECLRGNNRRRTLLGSTMAFLNSATGITFWFGYGTTFFIAAGLSNSFMISFILALLNAAFTVPGIFLVDKAGRRKTLLVGAIGEAVMQLVSAVMHTTMPGSNASNNMLVAGVVLFIVFYAPTWGNGGWAIMTEPFSDRLRISSITLVLIVYWLSNWLISFVTPYLVDADSAGLGVNVCYIWCGMATLSCIWTYFCVPEFSGLTRDEIDTLFKQHVPAWKSTAWRDRTVRKRLEALSGNEHPDNEYSVQDLVIEKK